jgi:hypothetical protein
MTIQWSIIGEGLKGNDNQSKGLSFWDHPGRKADSTRMTSLHNYLVSNGSRSPRLVSPGDMQAVNNVIDNSNGGMFVIPKYGPLRVEIVGNCLRHGPLSPNKFRWHIARRSGL